MTATAATPPERFLCQCGVVRDNRHGPRCAFRPLGRPLYRCPICQRVSEEHQYVGDLRHLSKCRYYPSEDIASLERVREPERQEMRSPAAEPERAPATEQPGVAPRRGGGLTARGFLGKR